MQVTYSPGGEYVQAFDQTAEPEHVVTKETRVASRTTSRKMAQVRVADNRAEQK